MRGEGWDGEGKGGGIRGAEAQASQGKQREEESRLTFRESLWDPQSAESFLRLEREGKKGKGGGGAEFGRSLGRSGVKLGEGRELAGKKQSSGASSRRAVR